MMDGALSGGRVAGGSQELPPFVQKTAREMEGQGLQVRAVERTPEGLWAVRTDAGSAVVDVPPEES